MGHQPAFDLLAEPIGREIVALRSFGGGLNDPVAAELLINGTVCMQIVAPATVLGDAAALEAFRREARALAETRDLLGRLGRKVLSFTFDPPGSPPTPIHR
jgi:hypothetical protein